MANVTGTFTATGQSAPFSGASDVNASVKASLPFNVSAWGTFSAALQIERSFDSGVTWLPLTALGTSISFTAPFTEVFEEPEDGVLYRLNCTSYSSGTVNYRISQ